MMNRVSNVYPSETPYELFSQIERKFDSLNHDIMRLKNLLIPNYSGNNDNYNQCNSSQDRREADLVNNSGVDMNYSVPNRFESQENNVDEILLKLYEGLKHDEEIDVDDSRQNDSEMIKPNTKEAKTLVVSDGGGGGGEQPSSSSQDFEWNPRTTLKKERREKITRSSCICPICQKILSNKWNLVKHMRIHSGERPFKCTECGKAFIDNTGLRRHTVKHTGDRYLNCSYCGKAYRSITNLRNHLLTHADQKQLFCSLCNNLCNNG